MAKFLFFLSKVRLLPHLILFRTHNNRDVIQYEVERWMKILKINKDPKLGFLLLMTFFPEYRNLFYHRIGINASLYVSWLCPKMNTLYLNTRNIGPGLFIQHGFSTIIAARYIGKDCWINQQVTIGYSNGIDCPTIGNNVTINAGAKIIGGITMGDNSIAGANAVVVKNVPESCTVVGIPAYIVRRNGEKIQKCND
ncbi:hypothetical protein SLH46_21400 [Draconibacterium sp. IB214405]|uniref:serine O-acetyltransferase n=1 Tax=Draconibacterium sp. IB214405 TaxID=3097352 RepID=UPI002A11F784|nr:hypothetical protein [Draconibacterium sp. IB214405]MDX8341770.1 hypothetical protein [Draconibacterium sp. IB214405]